MQEFSFFHCAYLSYNNDEEIIKRPNNAIIDTFIRLCYKNTTYFCKKLNITIINQFIYILVNCSVIYVEYEICFTITESHHPPVLPPPPPPPTEPLPEEPLLQLPSELFGEVALCWIFFVRDCFWLLAKFTGRTSYFTTKSNWKGRAYR